MNFKVHMCDLLTPVARRACLLLSASRGWMLYLSPSLYLCVQQQRGSNTRAAFGMGHTCSWLPTREVFYRGGTRQRLAIALQLCTERKHEMPRSEAAVENSEGVHAAALVGQLLSFARRFGAFAAFSAV